MKTHSNPVTSTAISRREFSRRCVLGAAALASTSLIGVGSARAETGPASSIVSLDNDWLFLGKLGGSPGTTGENVTVPHCVAKLSWENWDPASWQDVFLYRRKLTLSPKRGHRTFLKFEGVMIGAKVTFNNVTFPEHVGGYLPFEHEITQYIRAGENLIDVAVDARWQSVPPEGSPKGLAACDYYLPGGIARSVKLVTVPDIFISDVHAKPLNVLTADRFVEATVTIDAQNPPKNPVEILLELKDGATTLCHTALTLEQRHPVTESQDPSLAKTPPPYPVIEKEGKTTVKFPLTNLGDIKLWDTETPVLYDVVTTLKINGREIHQHRTRIGFREAKFTTGGFFLNGKRQQLFGLDRHELYPYVGTCMPPRVMRKDAEILKRDFNCNIVRCSHYPQTEAFLDACDELGLMVWQEPPGWGYVGDEAWQELVVRDVTDMIMRDRNHAAIVIWGVRVNESRNVVPLYERTTKIAKELDGTRACSGSMTVSASENWKHGWHEDVYAYDDYQNGPNGEVFIDKPTPGVPYMLAETVGGFAYGKGGFGNKYRRAGDLQIQVNQGLYHAQAHEQAARNPANCGAIAWLAFDYGSPMNAYNGVKCPGVADVFRIPKLGASFYLSQVSPEIRPVILPDFYWDFGPPSPRGPGKGAAIFSNCDRLEIFVAGQSVGTFSPDKAHYAHLAHPPFFCDLDLDGSSRPELRIDGYVGEKKILSKTYSPDPAQDQFLFAADDAELIGDGADATRLSFIVADKYGSERAFAGGTVKFDLTGPGVLVGDNPFSLADSGGVGAVWVKSTPNGQGEVKVTATHSVLGSKTVSVNIKPAV